ncbi:MAG: type VI secretion system tube protein Hcp, partial [Candidatus Aminicenantes bacterium]|nr:type VI secretion system tube protein Hcp [Candidatus Aminicenantes bacterium]
RQSNTQANIFTKEIDKTSPLLAKALANSEPVTKAHFKFYRPSKSGAGTEEHYYTITLESGNIVSMVTFTDSVEPYHFEEISISFSSITWTNETSGATHRDDWLEKEDE